MGLMQQINGSVDKLKVLNAEQKFIRNSNVLDYGEYTLILEDGMYVLYHDNEAVRTDNNFTDAFIFINGLTK